MRFVIRRGIRRYVTYVKFKDEGYDRVKVKYTHETDGSKMNAFGYYKNYIGNYRREGGIEREKKRSDHPPGPVHLL